MEGPKNALISLSLFILLSLSMEELCNGYMYKGVCMPHCPHDTFIVPYKQICVKRCPLGYPFVLHKARVRRCPSAFRAKRQRCVRNRTRVQKRSIASLCNGLHCSFPRRMCYNLQCLERCPDTTYIVNNTCVDTCPPHLPYILNRTCVSRCPNGFLLTAEYTCVQPITKNIYQLNSVCPNDYPYTEITSRGRECVSKCREGNYLYGSFCLPLCKNEDKDTDKNNVTICSRKCPPHLFLDWGEKCVKSCGQDNLVQDGKCIFSSDCNSIVENGVCTGRQNCPPFYYTESYEKDGYMNSKAKKCLPMSRYVSYFFTLLFALLFCLLLLWVIACNGRRTIHQLCKWCCSYNVFTALHNYSPTGPDHSSPRNPEEQEGLLAEDLTEQQDGTVNIQGERSSRFNKTQNRNGHDHYVQIQNHQTLLEGHSRPARDMDVPC